MSLERLLLMAVTIAQCFRVNYGLRKLCCRPEQRERYETSETISVVEEEYGGIHKINLAEQ